MAEINNSANASKVPNNGTATLTSFRYYRGMCMVTLDNGVTGIIGEAVDMPLPTMLQLKGTAIGYKHTGSKDGYERYQLEFVL